MLLLRTVVPCSLAPRVSSPFDFRLRLPVGLFSRRFTAQLALGQRALSILESALRVANAQPPLLPLPSVFFSSSPPVGPSASVPLASGAPDRQHSSLQQQQQQPQQQQLNHVGFDHATWHWLLRATLGLCDRLLVLPERRADNKLGDALALRVTHLALGAHLASLQVKRKKDTKD